MAAKCLWRPHILLLLSIVAGLLAGCDTGIFSWGGSLTGDQENSDEVLDGQNSDGTPAAFETVQPDGTIIRLKAVGNEAYGRYEDEAGYSVVQKAGQYYYAIRGDDGNLAASDYVVGEDSPQSTDLQPGISASEEAIMEVDAELSVRPKKDAIDNFEEAAAPGGTAVIEGDIVVPDDGTDKNDPAGSRCYIRTNRWPNGIVPYVFDANVDSTNKARMRESMLAWEAVANVRFTARTAESNYVHIFSGSGNWSYVGKIGGQQDLCIYNWTYKYIMAHELGHALGLWHEQSRADRDNYIKINWANIISGMSYNFDKHPEAAMTGSYDLDSVMHYSQCAFSVGPCSSKPTITVLAPNKSRQSQIGQITHLSVGDVAAMTEMYGSVPVPTASSALITTDAGTPVSGVLVATDPQGQPLTYRISTNGSYGNAVITDVATGAFTYTPKAGSDGKTDSFIFKASNGRVESLPATVTVKIFTGNILPAAGSVLTDRTVAFYWKAVPGAVAYHILAGSTSGGSDYFGQATGKNLYASVGGLPADGSTVYISVLAQQPDSSMQAATYSYAAPNTTPILTGPRPGTTLTGPTITFQWTPGYGAVGYQLCVGTGPKTNDILNKSIGNVTSYQVKGIPTNAKTIYVQLLTRTSSTGSWTYHPQVTYTAAYGNNEATGGAVISPAKGTVLTSSTATISWTAVKGATAYAISIESAPNRGDILNVQNVGTARSYKITTSPHRRANLVRQCLGPAWQGQALDGRIQLACGDLYLRGGKLMFRHPGTSCARQNPG